MIIDYDKIAKNIMKEASMIGEVTLVGDYSQRILLLNKEFPFVITQKPEEKERAKEGVLEGTGYDTVGRFRVAGRIYQDRITFLKRYSNGSTIRYSGHLNLSGEYVGEWNLEDDIPVGSVSIKGTFRMKLTERSQINVMKGY